MSDAWSWALAAWSRPGVEAVCLDLQNRHGQCPPLLLWRLWALEAGRSVPDDVPASASRLTRSWHDMVVDPLRAARRALATANDGVDDVGRLALRGKVRIAELAAERLLIDALESLVGDLVGAQEPAVDALLALTAAWGAVPPVDRLVALIDAVAGASQ